MSQLDKIPHSLTADVRLRNQSSDDMVVPAHFRQWLCNPSTFFGSPIGCNGYNLPDPESLVFCRMENSTSRYKVAENVSGTNNWIATCDEHVPKAPIRFTVTSGAVDNLVIFGENCEVFGEFRLIGSNNIIFLGGNAVQPSFLTVWLRGSLNLVFWGNKCTSNGTTINVDGCQKSVIVGEDCMFAKSTNVRNTDEHGIFDISTFCHLNPPESVHIEPHVWIGPEALVSKGTKVGCGSVVASKSVVSRSIPPMSMAAGLPAIVKRQGVSWDRSAMPRPERMAELKSWISALTD